ncbi:MAG TPA: class 1 fructose-bisphosphatase [Candidatus Saccharimonadales bacterium]|nr:class 1 fructose-bisphosphatase [Candidatus Saccharimonadales bacterium]
MTHQPGTLQQFLLGELQSHPEKAELVMMMADLATIGKLISARLSRAGLTGGRGYTESSNVHDEAQAKLDVWSNDLCKNYLSSTGLFAALASEEEETVVDLKNPDGKYVIAFDPLDGSTNIDTNGGVGTIFSVHKKLENLPAGDEKQFLQSGRDQVLAGYIYYGPSTILVFSWGDGVHECTLDNDLGEFLLSSQTVTWPSETPYYSFNEAYADRISQLDHDQLSKIRGLADKLRWAGALVADFHRSLLKGGIFFMPAFAADSGSTEFKPKLRLNYEAQPMALLAEQSGAVALADGQNVLDIVPGSLHQKVPLVIAHQSVIKQL